MCHAALALTLLFCETPSRARADDTYEQKQLDAALAAGRLSPDPDAEGKRIAFVRVVRDEVFVEGEPYPTLLNVLHWRSTAGFVRGELLLRAGDPYRETLARESERNLRARGWFSFVRVVPVKAARPGEVGVLVHTRDRWSLRPEPDWAGTFAGGFEHLQIDLTERNLFGTGRQAVLSYRYTPFTDELRETYLDRRFFGEELSLRESFAVLFNRDRGGIETTRGELSLGRPFYTLEDRVSWEASTEFDTGVRRRVTGADYTRVKDENETNLMLRPVFDDDSVKTRVSGSYRRGEHYKQTFTLGAGYENRSVAANAETQLMPGQEDLFERYVLPETRRDVFPFAGYDLFVPRYEVFENLTTFGVSEAVREGPYLNATFALPLRLWGASNDAFEVEGGAGYVLAGGGALAEARAEGAARLDDRSGARDFTDRHVVDRRLTLLLRGASPVVAVARLVWSARWAARRNDTQKTLVDIAGTRGLRSHSDLSNFGGSAVEGSVELRSLPLDLHSVQLGAVLFYDAGAVYHRLREPRGGHGVGAGLRLVLPQIEPVVFSFDFAAPLEKNGFAFVFGIGQHVKLLEGEE